MPIRTLLWRFLNDERIIQKLADSYPIRTAAKAVAGVLHVGKYSVMKTAERALKDSSLPSPQDFKLQRFSQNFKDHLRKEWSENKPNKFS